MQLFNACFAVRNRRKMAFLSPSLMINVDLIVVLRQVSRVNTKIYEFHYDLYIYSEIRVYDCKHGANVLRKYVD